MDASLETRLKCLDLAVQSKKGTGTVQKTADILDRAEEFWQYVLQSDEVVKDVETPVEVQVAPDNGPINHTGRRKRKR